MTSCDLLLVVGYFRSATPLLSVIRHLSKTFKIGVVFLPLDEKTANKTGSSQAVFEKLCVDFGAVVMSPDAPIKARAMIVQQYPYPTAFIEKIKENVDAPIKLGLLTLAWAGIEIHDAFIEAFGLQKLFAADDRFISFLLERRHAEARYKNVERIEVGLPYREYPVFPEFVVDWMIVAPTLFSFHTEEGKQSFLRDTLKLLAQIPATDVVAYKSHNGNAKDYFAPRVHYALGAVIAWIPGIEGLLSKLASLLPDGLARPLHRLVTSLLHRRVVRRARPLCTLTPYSEISFEAFLPGVRKGVIGGLSNTIWGTLYFGLPYFNCVNDEDRRGGESKLLKKSSADLLDTNLEYFGVPYCRGLIANGAFAPHVAYAKERHRDLLSCIRAELSC